MRDPVKRDPMAAHAAATQWRRARAKAAAAEAESRGAMLLKLSFGLLVAAGLLIVSAAASFAGPASDEDAAASRDVIERQLDAFSRDAWGEAFGFAGPGVQSIFQTPERFAAMVKGGYAMVWRPASVEFLSAEAVGDGVMQRLRIVDRAGDAHLARYFLRETEAGWRIEGVEIEKEPALAA